MITLKFSTLDLNVIHNINGALLMNSGGVQCQWDIGYGQEQHQ